MSMRNSGTLSSRTKQELLQLQLPNDFSTGKKLLHDETERRIPQPFDYEDQQTHYSGKIHDTWDIILNM